METRINTERMVSRFLELARIPSPSFREEEVFEYCRARLSGLEIREYVYSGTMEHQGKNLLAVLPGNSDRHRPLMLGAHADTVTPCVSVEPVIDGDTIRSAGDTILGADNKAAIAVILETVDVLRESGIPHGRLEILLTSAEETGLYGARAFDTSVLAARECLVIDASGAPGTAVNEAPGHTRFLLNVRGKKAHAGIEPENGINAINAAAGIISAVRTGKLDEDSTANWGIITGGTAGNIVADLCTVEGEVRSHRPGRRESWLRELETACTAADREYGTLSTIEIINSYSSYALPPDSPPIREVEKACDRIGLPFRTHRAGGCSDANVLNEKGLLCLNLACGMRDVHTTNESIRIQDMENTARLILDLVTEGFPNTPGE